jgi:hypothetical protein
MIFDKETRKASKNSEPKEVIKIILKFLILFKNYFIIFYLNIIIKI